MEPKNYVLLCLFMVFSFSCKTQKQSLIYNGFPVIKSQKETIDYKVDEDWFNSYWSIAPQVAHDTLQIKCYEPNVDFLFQTDLDSISFKINPGQTYDFYVLIDDQYAHTIIQGIAFETDQLSFENQLDPKITFKHQQIESAYLTKLKKTYPIELPISTKSDMQKVNFILNWTNSRWEHDGNNSPKKSDAISILDEVSAGERFPCFAYGIVLKDQLNALGFKARTIYLKTKDAATSQSPPGHVATEVYLNDIGKWIFVDPQFNVIPTLNNVPLNAVEFQNAISQDLINIELKSLNQQYSKAYYIDFIHRYLFYFDTTLDNRYDTDSAHQIDDKSSLMLVPKDAPSLKRINFWDMDLTKYIYTNSLKDFYQNPNE